ncbi:lipoprotein [Collimonas sp.]|uniref:LPS translocon maturation chaperone LptM n=1 Tax=Collimonas sp. TaxID=1963772 RepID=UPI0037BF7688
MKPTFDFSRAAMMATALTLSVLLAACGQKGPLFMPVALPPPAAKTPTPAVKPTIPAPAAAADSGQSSTATVPATSENMSETSETPKPPATN